jgi:hypothetical protein
MVNPGRATGKRERGDSELGLGDTVCGGSYGRRAPYGRGQRSGASHQDRHAEVVRHGRLERVRDLDHRHRAFEITCRGGHRGDFRDHREKIVDAVLGAGR